MRKQHRNSLVLFVVLSLLLHAAGSVLLGRLDRSPDSELVPLEATPVLRATGEEQPRPESVAPEVVPPGTQRFRPTEMAETPRKEQSPLDPPSCDPPEQPAVEPAPPSPMTAEEHERYRHELLAHFEPDWKKIPDLVVVADPETQRAVSRFFGMPLIAYPKGEAKPGYAIVIDEETGACRYTRDFDFSRYSNRVKDRSNVEKYAQLVRRAKSHLAIPDELAIVSLVPAEADAYFAAKQMEALRAASLSVDDIDRTEGHYARDLQGQYLLIIDRVVTRQGKRVQVDDRERGVATAS